jgi:hypothetical protein
MTVPTLTGTNMPKATDPPSRARALHHPIDTLAVRERVRSSTTGHSQARDAELFRLERTKTEQRLGGRHLLTLEHIPR